MVKSGKNLTKNGKVLKVVCVFGRFVCIAMSCGYGGWKEIKAKKTTSILKSMTKSLVVERL